MERVPGLSGLLESAEGNELIELLDAFDVAVSYDKPSRTLELSASTAGYLLSKSEARDRGRSQGS